MATLRLRLHLEEGPETTRGSVVRIAVRDTSLADALHPTVVEATHVVDSPAEEMDIAVDVPEGALHAGNRYSVWAHVDRDGSGSIQPGDLITTQDVPVTPTDIGSEPLDVPLARI